jgi:hypothetical protein
MGNPTIAQQELQAFLDAFCEAFSTFSGELTKKLTNLVDYLT